MLNTIRFAEGTWRGGLDVGYRVMFGGGRAEHGSPSRPRDLQLPLRQRCGRGLPVHAVHLEPGAAQHWREGFGPAAQDQGALFLIERRKALPLTDPAASPRT